MERCVLIPKLVFHLASQTGKNVKPYARTSETVNTGPFGETSSMAVHFMTCASLNDPTIQIRYSVHPNVFQVIMGKTTWRRTLE